jgi:dipeptidyl-peptidase-4
VTNVDEYFAELTEAYFGRNDFYPFDRADLERHDPAGYKALDDIWRK